MPRTTAALASLTVLGLAAILSARSHPPQIGPNRVAGFPVRSRIPCDGSTNYQQEIDLVTTFSPAGSPRSFHVDQFQSQYCKHLDLYFVCVKHGRDGWKHEWEAASTGQPGPSRFWANSCSAWGSQQTADYLLSGWYQEGEGGPKAPWKQAILKQVAGAPEVYEFTDPAGGTARLEIRHK